MFRELTNGNFRRIGNRLVGENNVALRIGRDGRARIDIPASVGRSGRPETVHFSP
jgi:hypothetical protein